MIRRQNGRIINISSTAGKYGAPSRVLIPEMVVLAATVDRFRQEPQITEVSSWKHLSVS